VSDEALLQQAHNDVLRAFVAALDLHCPGEGGHAERVAVMSVATAHEMGLRGEDLRVLRCAAALHDVGKVAIDRTLLTKRSGLTQSEIEELRLHAALAVRVVSSLAWLQPALPLIRHHHERWDGSGYPDGLSGESIPLGARIAAVAEAFDMMTFGAGFRDPVGPDAALEELRRCAGSQFDKAVVNAFCRIQPLIQPLQV
jgi:two-component system cell cycle response regulator